MHIGLKNGKIVAFNKDLADLKINASAKRIALDAIEETEEEIVPYYNTSKDGIYFKKSEVPQPPKDKANDDVRTLRRELYAISSDPITNNIAVLKDMIEYNDYASEEERLALEQEINELYHKRKAIREQIANENPFFE